MFCRENQVADKTQTRLCMYTQTATITEDAIDGKKGMNKKGRGKKVTFAKKLSGSTEGMKIPVKHSASLRYCHPDSNNTSISCVRIISKPHGLMVFSGKLLFKRCW